MWQVLRHLVTMWPDYTGHRRAEKEALLWVPPPQSVQIKCSTPPSSVQREQDSNSPSPLRCHFGKSWPQLLRNNATWCHWPLGANEQARPWGDQTDGASGDENSVHLLSRTSPL